MLDIDKMNHKQLGNNSHNPSNIREYFVQHALHIFQHLPLPFGIAIQSVQLE